MPSPGKLVVNTAVAALGFVGVTAVAGGVEMVVFSDGNEFVKSEWLDDLPVSSYRLPGLVLGVGLGAGSLATALGLARRPEWRALGWVERVTGRHWSWAATVAVGVGLGAWIALEVLLIPERSAIEALYGAIAIGLLVIASSRPFRSALAVGLS